jgi:hypothetical protein
MLSASVFALLAVPFVIQALALSFDEFVCHRRRGLPRWECIGHPLDTASVFLPVAVVIFRPLDLLSFIVFCLAALFSCLFVTKDEWVHARECNAVEHWLHSVLFVCHPLVFVSTGVLWSWRDVPHVFGLDPQWNSVAQNAIFMQFSVLILFCLYQIIYWNIVRRPISGSASKWTLQETKSESVGPQSFASEIE